MAEILTTKEIQVALENIIKRAEKYICIFTFNIRIDSNYLTRLRNAAKRNISITIVFGVAQGDPAILDPLLSIPGITVRYKKSMHAKFFYNEKELLIGSMNLSEASGNNNSELGVLFKDSEYQQLIVKVKEEAKEIISDSVLWDHQSLKDQRPANSLHLKKGVCIRCAAKINFDPSRPLCFSCYSLWSEWENEYYEEIYCHCCGMKKQNISFAKPECLKCFTVVG